MEDADAYITLGGMLVFACLVLTAHYLKLILNELKEMNGKKKGKPEDKPKEPKMQKKWNRQA